MHYIYTITCLIDKKVYVGKSNNLHSRWRGHRTIAKNINRPQSCPYLYYAMRKHGVENFVITKISTHKSEQLAYTAEVKLIKKLRSNETDYGYNLNAGGLGSVARVVSLETRKKLSIKHKGKILSLETRIKIGDAQRGHKRGPISEATRKKLQDAAKGRIITPEWRLNMSLSAKKRKRTPEGNKAISLALKGHVVTPETRAKIGAANKGRIASAEERPAMSLARKGRPKTEETKSRIRAGWARRKNLLKQNENAGSLDPAPVTADISLKSKL